MRGGQIDVASHNSRSINVLAGLTQRFRRKGFALGGAISLATGFDSSITHTTKFAPLAPMPSWKVVAATVASLISSSLSRTQSAAFDAEGGLARPIGLPATCQLQSIAKPLSVDANAVP
jgi:hypothetical protein